MIATDVEMSKELLGLGLDAKSADMYWERTTSGSDYTLKVGKNVAVRENLFSFRRGCIIPAWSVSALMELMPNIDGIDVEISRIKVGDGMGYDGYYYPIQYKDVVLIPYCKSLLDAAYKMVCWLIEEEYIK